MSRDNDQLTEAGILELWEVFMEGSNMINSVNRGDSDGREQISLREGTEVELAAFGEHLKVKIE